ncbi:UNVERIFIED_CONTAM: hypothetical protein PYX00_006272 [Menopon gallinae]|uniref:Small-subunit processome Utp12 domain-containing protein n=1 Tax=Menopon gallinae TaxID=328185 RepID=A0AAW2HWA8_9NEOP
MAGSVSGSSYSFNESGLLLAHWSSAGKLKIWDTSTGTVKQEYTKNLHLTSPCTCLYWLQCSKRVTPKKKKLKSSGHDSEDREVIVMGTTLGNILVYDLALNDVKNTLEGHTSKVNSLSSSNNSSIFSCSDDGSIIEWDMENFEMKSKWKTGNESATCILALSNGSQLLSASYTIKLWDLYKKQVIRVFTGHGTEVASLVEMPGVEDYFFSSAVGDRVISAWSLASKEKTTAVASFILQDSPSSVKVHNAAPDSPSTLCAVTESGVVQIFKHKLNGNITKPMKPVTTVSIASENPNAKHSHPLSIYAILPLHSGSFIIAYGTPVFLLFETITVNDKEENMVLVREDKRKIVTSEFNSKVKVPEVNENAEYEAPATSSAKRRRKKLDVDVPLEERIENLALVNTISSDAPKKDNMAHLLIQGLQSRDRTILNNILFQTDDAVVNSTVKNLPAQALVPLVRELTRLLSGQTYGSKCAVTWLTSVLRHHSGVLLSNPEIGTFFEPILSATEAHLSLLPSLLRLKGRLGLIMDQIETNAKQDDECTNEPLITYQEQDSSDDGEIDLPSEGSDSDENWDDISGTEDDDEEMDEK